MKKEYNYICTRKYITKSGETKTSVFRNRVVRDIKFERTGRKKKMKPTIKKIVDIRKTLSRMKEFNIDDQEQINNKLDRINEILCS